MTLLLAALLPAALLLAAFFAASATAEEPDPRVAWLRRHALEVSSLDPASTGFQDLEPMKEVLAGVRVVLLGEASHGDGSSLRAKSRLVAFLHREMGFDLLVFEAGLYAGDRAWRRIRAGADAREALGPALPGGYASAVELGPVFDLITARARGERPLEVAGFDHQLTGEAGARELMDGLRGELRRRGADPEALAELAGVTEILLPLSRDAYFTGQPLPSRSERKAFVKALAAAAERLEPAAGGGDPEAAFWLQVTRNLESWAEGTWKLARWDPVERFARGATHVPPEIQNVRFRQMGDNLLWLARRRYPERKIIVWSTTIHLTRDLDRLTTGEADTRERFDRFRTPGDLVAEELKEQAYLLAFTAFTGRKGRALPGRVPSPLLEPTRGSFEDLMSRTGLAAAIVDLRREVEGGQWLRRPLIARPISHKELLGIWPRHVDGLFFLHTLEPAHRLDG